jgi:hypothetical protein
MQNNNKIIVVALVLNLILSTYAVVTVRAQAEKVGAVQASIAEIAQVLGKSGVIEAGEDGKLIINPIVRVKDVQPTM